VKHINSDYDYTRRGRELGILALSQRNCQARVTPNATATRANKPSATRWLADEYGFELGFDADEVVFEELAEVGTGVPVATAPTPPVTAPVKEI
jgi:hypothetical protein